MPREHGDAYDPSSIPVVSSWAAGGTDFLRSYIMRLSEKIPPGPPVELPVHPQRKGDNGSRTQTSRLRVSEAQSLGAYRTDAMSLGGIRMRNIFVGNCGVLPASLRGNPLWPG